ncbi:hypothetical protein TNCV_4111031 [Trichonephila clavipes]|nr:hypothetical protein TNCV_4111031 [Trichonephila clavipes]
MQPQTLTWGGVRPIDPTTLECFGIENACNDGDHTVKNCDVPHCVINETTLLFVPHSSAVCLRFIASRKIHPYAGVAELNRNIQCDSCQPRHSAANHHRTWERKSRLIGVFRNEGCDVDGNERRK